MQGFYLIFGEKLERSSFKKKSKKNPPHGIQFTS